MVMEPTFIRMEPNTKVNGSRICSMGKARNIGQMVQYLWVSIEKERRTDWASTNGLMEHAMMENGKTMR